MAAQSHRGSLDNTIRLWDTGSGAPKRTLMGHTSWVNSVAFSPDGRTIASGSWDDTIYLWDAGERHPQTHHSPGIFLEVHSVAFSPDGRTIASGSFDATIRLWDAGSGAPKRTLTGHTDSRSEA